MKDRNLSSAQCALSEIRKIREGKIKASEAYRLKDNDIYEEVDEEEYQSIIRERINNNFVVDDDGMGYEDDGRDLMENYISLPEDNMEVKKNDRKRKKELIKKGILNSNSILKQFQFASRNDEIVAKPKSNNMNSFDVLNTLKNFDDSLYNDLELNNSIPIKESIDTELQDVVEIKKENHSILHLEDSELVEEERNKKNEFFEKNEIFVIDEEEAMSKSSSIADEISFVEDIVETEVKEKEYKYIKLGDENLQGCHLSSVTLSDMLNEGENLNFYVLEIVEDNNTGELYLFGKIMMNNDIKNIETCCVVIKETWKSLYVYPRESTPNHPDPITACQKVAKEILDIRKEYNIPKIQMKPVIRHFCFMEKEVLYGPNQPFLKILYSSKNPSLPSNITGKTFSHIFGINTSITENFIIKREIKGPSWLKIMKPYQIISVGGGRKSQCKVEIHVQNWKTIRSWNCSINIAPKSELNENIENLVIKKERNIITNDGTLPSSPSSTLTCINIYSRLTSFGSTNPEIYYISMITLKHVNIDDICWDEYNSSDILQKKIPNNCDIQTWIGIRRIDPSKTFPLGSEEKMEKSGIKYFSTERSLLLAFISSFSQMDPDIIVGHNIWSDHLEILINRLINLNIPNINKLGRIYKPTNTQKYNIKSFSNTKRIQSIFQGRLICDTCLSSREFMKSRIDYQLSSIFSDIFSKDIHLIKACEKNIQNDFFMNTYKSYDSIFKTLYGDLLITVGVLKLLFHLQVLPLTRELTNLAGFLWSKSLLFLRAERNEYLLLHELHKNKFIAPDVYLKINKQKHKNFDESTFIDFERQEGCNKKDESYSGGLVLEPIIGLYDSFVLLLDFNSLYPSIIQEFNICFTTREPLDSNIENKTFAQLENSSFDQTILPGILETLVKRRKHIKEILKGMSDGTRKTQLEIRQLALKLTANSLYGCLGYKNSRFYAKDLASIITFYGRQILQKTKSKVEDEIKLQVIYGDTDSIMVNTNIIDEGNIEGYNNVIKISNQIKQMINKDYNKLEIDLDGVLQRLLLLKKKKYACIKIIDYQNKLLKLECKGLDLVRRDWSILTRNVSTQILNLIFSNQPLENVITNILNTLETLNETLNSNNIPIENYVITKTLTKLPQYYSDPLLLPHVTVAKRMISEGLPITSGTEIPYIICKEDLEFDSSEKSNIKSSSLSRRAYSIEEVKCNNLTIDFEWYKTQQLLPPISRLCSPIPGLEIGRLGQCLGLEYKHYVEIIQKEDSDQNNEVFSIFEWKKGPETYINVPITASIICYECFKIGNNESKCVFVYLKENNWYCQECGNQYSVEYLSNWLNNHLRTLTLGCYSSFHGICKECNIQTRRISLKNGFNCPQIHCQSKKSLVNDLSPHKIWLYLDHWLYWLTKGDTENTNSNNYKIFGEKTQNIEIFLKDIIINYMNINKYNHIQINNLFNLLKKRREYKEKKISLDRNYQEGLLINLWNKNLI